MRDANTATVATVLVIDDNAENRALAEAALVEEGFNVVLAASGEEGVAKFRESKPACVLLDIRMPGLDGFATCAQLRALPRGAQTPIVFLTAFRDIDNFDRATAAGGDDFLTKPVRPVELVARVRSQIKLRTFDEELRGHYAALEKQRDDLMRVQLQNERLTSFLIHDLKNPVDAIDLHAQLLLQREDMPADAQTSVQSIRDQGKQLTRMILNLLDIAKGDEGRLEPRLVDVADVDGTWRTVCAIGGTRIAVSF